MYFLLNLVLLVAGFNKTIEAFMNLVGVKPDFF